MEVAQLGRRKGKDKDRREETDDIAYADRIGQDADHILVVRQNDDETRMFVRAIKSRHGKSKFDFEMRFDPNVGDLDEPKDEDDGFKDGFGGAAGLYGPKEGD